MFLLGHGFGPGMGSWGEEIPWKVHRVNGVIRVNGVRVTGGDDGFMVSERVYQSES